MAWFLDWRRSPSLANRHSAFVAARDPTERNRSVRGTEGRGQRGNTVNVHIGTDIDVDRRVQIRPVQHSTPKNASG
ncbi:hypothetical protein HYQ45_016205 [Verticillium longisporum]|uniref:Uncharacterized protein n=1 Tax=Verticillium longisporum TaxID=100787 RepID=A0A8I2Z7Y8_VERLO|nr:hypothetical protein HYQ44_018788 [Verticillium longisporum]KAG7115854.1 hypothetical protein HYQ45_016205 [Verticillium longisporum]